MVEASHGASWTSGPHGASEGVCGVDPGLDGALVVVSAEGIVACHDMPTLSLGSKRRVDPAGVADILAGVGPAVVERDHSMPKQGVASSFSFGESYGIILGVLAGLCIPYSLVTPQRWKKEMMEGQQREKDASRMVARQLWPLSAVLFKRKKDHGRADAALIGEWGRRRLARPIPPDFLTDCDPGDEA